MLLPVSHSATDDCKMKGAEKVKYPGGDEGGADGPDSTVGDSVLRHHVTL